MDSRGFAKILLSKKGKKGVFREKRKHRDEIFFHIGTIETRLSRSSRGEKKKRSHLHVALWEGGELRKKQHPQ